MARRKKKTRKPANLTHLAEALRSKNFSRMMRWVLGVAVIALALNVGRLGIGRLEAHVLDRLAGRASPTVVFRDLPESLKPMAQRDLDAAIEDLLSENWTSDLLCRRIAQRIAEVAWVAGVKHVRRCSDGRFDVRCRYRVPLAMAQSDGRFYLVGVNGVRLPGVYRYDPAWPLIQGAADRAPEPGGSWPGDDIQAGISVISALAHEPFRHQITAVLVDNHRGRVAPRESHLVLATNVAGGRILWGSAPGEGIEENSARQKLAILRANYRETGRVDANHMIIDISTFPDRYVVPE